MWLKSASNAKWYPTGHGFSDDYITGVSCMRVVVYIYILSVCAIGASMSKCTSVSKYVQVYNRVSASAWNTISTVCL